MALFYNLHFVSGHCAVVNINWAISCKNLLSNYLCILEKFTKLEQKVHHLLLCVRVFL